MVLLAVGASGCASDPIRADYDRSADFGSYRTYNFMDGAGPDEGGYQSLFTQYMIAAIDKEMESRGYTKSDDPDLLVNFNAIIREKTDIRTTPAPPPMGYYGYRGAYYGGWAGYGYATETHVSQYTEGTFNIDLVDAKRMRLVWEGVGVGRVTEKKLQNLEQAVNEGVPRFFEKYPFVAGSSQPAVTE